ncbi:hypothetical protein ACFWSF_09735 [Streptomyces sp. NPDC058611]|uniref:hypothetical protein n=1 Tax=unclassified Streptomyces TaxID=2593676 RepID=UPI003657B53E
MGVLRDNPKFALFLCLAVGYLVGKLRVGPITLGGICGTLMKISEDDKRVGYYIELDLLAEAERVHGQDFADFLEKNYEPVDPRFRLAEQT